MTKTKQRLKPDAVLKNYWRDNGRFADLFNAVLFGGRQVIRAQELQDLDTDESVVTQHIGHAESIRAVSLHGMLKIPAGLKKYVNDYRVLLIEARKHDLVFHNTDNADLFRLLGFFLDRTISKEEARKKAIQYSEEHGTDQSVIMTVAGIANSRIDSKAIKKRKEGQACTQCSKSLCRKE